MSAHPGLAWAAAVPMLVSAPTAAQSDDPDASRDTAESSEATEERYNTFLFGFSHAFRLLQDRGTIDSDLRRSENVYGFLFGYERILHRYVAVSIIKPFYFNRERVDSPLEIVVTGIFRKNRWEPFVGAGAVSILSRIKGDGGGSSGDTIDFAVGVLFVTGFKYFFTPHWAIEFEFGYEFIPTDEDFEHGFADSYQGAYYF